MRGARARRRAPCAARRTWPGRRSRRRRSGGARELREGRLVDAAAVLLDALAGARPELLERPARSRDADDRHVELPAPHHRLERGEDLLVGEVAGGAEEDQRVRARSRLTAPVSLLDVAAELEAHRGEHPVLEVRLAARAEALEERGREHVRGHAPRRSPPRASSAPRPSRTRGPRSARASDRSPAPPPSGRAATTRSRCRAATPRRCRRGRGRTGSARDCAAASSRRRRRAPRLPTLAWRRMLRPSAYAAISPYSMPLCTIFTK